MYRVALNTAITYFKKEKRRPDQSNLEVGMDVEEDSLTEKSTKLEHFYIAVKQLSKVEKALIIMYIDGLAHQEIADNLGISAGNARVKLNRTKKKLQAIIKAQGYEF
jgi:RNA polymerase sigma-70 factor (ECF subfamily)